MSFVLAQIIVMMASSACLLPSASVIASSVSAVSTVSVKIDGTGQAQDEPPYMPAPKPHPVGRFNDLFDLPVVDTHQRGIERRIDLPSWFHEAKKVPVGASYTFVAKDREEIRVLRALGFARTDVNRFERRVDLMAVPELTHFQSQNFPHVDAIVFLSIFRQHTPEQYLYRTLRSFFDEFPRDIEVNVLVGDADDAYVSQQALAKELGDRAARRVHVVACPNDVSEFFSSGDFSTSARANWNFSRALRAYEGSTNLMVFEDDIVYAHRSATNIAPWLAYMPAQVTYLFNQWCPTDAPAWIHPKSVFQAHFFPVARNLDYHTLQGAVFTSDIAGDAGDYIAQRLDRESHDFLLARFLSGTTGGAAMFFPSPVQHIGHATTGLSGEGHLPISRCFQPELGLIDDSFSGGM